MFTQRQKVLQLISILISSLGILRREVDTLNGFEF